jgi:formate-dependent nitrite reductase cytochrome c552 subunit
MVYYTDEPTRVNKRAVAGYYLFLCLIGFAILLGPTGSGIPINIIGNQLSDEHLMSAPGAGTEPDDCMGCHSNEYNNWSTTNHATHMDTYNATHVRIGAYAWFSWALFNSTCSECHTSGWDNSTGTPTYDALGVNCFACHSGDPVTDYSGESCNPCHLPSGEEHPHQMTAWENSAHANSLTDLRTSDHAASYCMHCMATEGFIDYQAGGTAHNSMLVNGTYNSISCSACHAVHANYSSNDGQIRAASTSELCGSCHVGDRHATYQTWTGGPHALAGVECIDCHGYDVAPGDHVFLNHTFLVNLDESCGQSDECHEGLEDWAIDQLEIYQASYDELTAEIDAEVAAFGPIVEAYNATAGANHTLANIVLEAIDNADGMVSLYYGDGSHGFHHPHQIFGDLNAAYADLLDAKALFYEMTGGPAGGGGVPADTLIIVAGAAGGIVVGLLLGVLVGRRR